MKETKISYEEFVSQLRCRLYEIIPEDVNMEVNPVLKNNSLHLDSLVLFRQGSNCSPSFYLQNYYKKYRNGYDIDVLAEDIYERWQRFIDSTDNQIPDLSLAHCRDRIVYRLVNASRNREMLKKVPFIPFFDLAIVFYYVLRNNADGIQSLRINTVIQKRWELTIKDLFHLASQNTPRMFPERFRSMHEFLEQYPMPEELSSEDVPWELSPYVLTNSNGINGAAVWLYPEVLERTGQKLGASYYILPSSTHELLILKDQNTHTSKDLLDMVYCVNRKCVDPEEFLSDNIYFYDCQKKNLKMIGTDGSTQNRSLQNALNPLL